MASSLGYAMMNWTSEFARHAKAKTNKKKNSKNKENCDGNKMISLSDINKPSKSALSASVYSETNEVEVQTEGK